MFPKSVSREVCCKGEKTAGRICPSEKKNYEVELTAKDQVTEIVTEELTVANAR